MDKSKQLGLGILKNFGRMLLLLFSIGNVLIQSSYTSLFELSGMIFGALVFWTFLEYSYHKIRKTNIPLKDTFKAWVISGAVVFIPLLMLSTLGSAIYSPVPVEYSYKLSYFTYGSASLAIPMEMKEAPHLTEAWTADMAYTVGDDIVTITYAPNTTPNAFALIEENYFATRPEVNFTWRTEGDRVYANKQGHTSSLNVDIDSVLIWCHDGTYELLYGSWAKKDEKMSELVLSSLGCTEI